MNIALKDIWIDRNTRQRKDIQVDDLMDSIQLRGVLVPIIVTTEDGPDGEPYKLVAGERRYTACERLGLAGIPAHLMSDLPQSEQRMVELEENLRRKDLGWQDQCLAIANIHDIITQQNNGESNWARTAKAIGYDPSWVQRCCRVAKELHRESIRKSESFMRAWNFISREDERVAADAVSHLLSSATDAAAQTFSAPAGSDALADLMNEPLPPENPIMGPSFVSARTPPLVTPAEESILQQSFLDWAPTYQGRPFNLIHCDFPHDDTSTLIACLCSNLDRLMAHSAHLIFWLSGDIKIQSKTLAMFAELAPMLSFNSFPLIWVKSDNVGIIPDPKREPRRIYETALIASREDRLLVKPVSNAYAAPTNKEHHPHTKPEPVLRHFMQMFVDRNTRMLDPTCGGGSSLRAAESLGAEHVFGLELNDEYVQNARRALNHSRVHRIASSTQKEQIR